MTDRCEPPPELRGVDGWHWVQQNERQPVIAQWDRAIWMHTRMPLGLEDCAKSGWRYLAPVATPAEVEALRIAKNEWRQRWEDCENVNTTLRARVAELDGALDTLVMACELPGDHCEVEQSLPAARAALSPKTP